MPPITTPTVTADALPTVQINGVVWDQVVVGNSVYVDRPVHPGPPGGCRRGTNETARSNILAYDLTTGALITSFAPALNAQGLAIAASPDGSRIYVGGDFTQVNGVNRSPGRRARRRHRRAGHRVRRRASTAGSGRSR